MRRAGGLVLVSLAVLGLGLLLSAARVANDLPGPGIGPTLMFLGAVGAFFAVGLVTGRLRVPSWTGGERRRLR